ncbi:MAG: hypothetical protein ABI134_32145 [Byssovorax sp.]
MMRRFVKSVLVGLAGLAALTALSTGAEAQEIQLTGPLAGAPAVRKLRLHRAGRFEVAPGVSFSLLDQYQRTIMPGAALTYHVTDWLGFGVWGGFGFQYNAGLADELQTKAIDGRNCAQKSFSKACKLTATNLTHGKIADDQLGKMQWIVAPQVQVVPFRGKLALFSSLFVDTDVNIFAGPAFIGLQERADCGKDGDGAKLTPCSAQSTFTLASRVAVAPTFGLGLNFYPSSFVGFGFEFRALPFAWNTSGFDNHGGGANEDFPDLNVNSADREFHFNSMLTVHASFQFPTAIKTTD